MACHVAGHCSCSPGTRSFLSPCAPPSSNPLPGLLPPLGLRHPAAASYGLASGGRSSAAAAPGLLPPLGLRLPVSRSFAPGLLAAAGNRSAGRASAAASPGLASSSRSAATAAPGLLTAAGSRPSRLVSLALDHGQFFSDVDISDTAKHVPRCQPMLPDKARSFDQTKSRP